MADASAASNTTKDVIDYLVERVREEHPYLKAAVLDQLVAKTAALITTTIEAEYILSRVVTTYSDHD